MPPPPSNNPRKSTGGAAHLTYPVLPVEELIDLCRDGLGIPISVKDMEKPTPALVSRLCSALLEIITQVQRQEVGAEVSRRDSISTHPPPQVQAVVDDSSHPELFRDALPQLVQLREMELLAQASLADFRLEDLTSPTGSRLQKLLSATLNFGRFYEGVMQQHAEQTEPLTKLQEQVKQATLHLGELAAAIKDARERQAKALPEMTELEAGISKQEATLRAYAAQQQVYESAIDEDRKKTEANRRHTEQASFDLTSAQAEKGEVESQLVSSPQRIKREQATQRAQVGRLGGAARTDASNKVSRASWFQLTTRTQVEREQAELERAQAEERALGARLADVSNAEERVLNPLASLLGDVEQQLERTAQAEAQAVERKSRIDNHAYRVRDLKQLELESVRKLALCEDRQQRHAQARAAKVDALRRQIKQAQEEREQRERDEEDAAKRSARLSAEAAALKQQIAKQREDQQEQSALRQRLFAEVMGAFDGYVKAVNESAEMVARVF